MPRIVRIGVYAYPPAELLRLIETVWRGELDAHEECELTARHAGECPLWGAHVTLLDAVSILDKDRREFESAQRAVVSAYLPLELAEPHIRQGEWGSNVYLTWRDDEAYGRLRELRHALAAAAREFVVTELLDCEKVNELDRTIEAMHALQPPPEIAPFSQRVERLKALLLRERLELLYAPNVPLEWYVEQLGEAGALRSGVLPFPLSPHMSIATGVRGDERRGLPAEEVGRRIVSGLSRNPAFAPLLGSSVRHRIDNAFFVEPDAPANAIEVAVRDRISGRVRVERRQPWKPTSALLPERSAADGTALPTPNRTVFCYWTRWAPPKQGTAEAAAEQAFAVVRECYRFACDSMEGRAPGAMFLMKTPGRGVADAASIRAEEHAWQDAMARLAADFEATRFEFRYVAAELPVCAAWNLAWNLSRWWENGDILAFPAMDLIEPRLAAPFNFPGFSEAPGHVQSAVLAAPLHFGRMLGQTAGHRGLAIGGYRTYEADGSASERRGGLSAKDLLEASIRCYASGVLAGHDGFRALLERQPRLRVRSEILALHRDCWTRLREGRRLSLEPWELTVQLILGALLEGCAVSQVDFRWLIEEGSKDDPRIVEQLQRGCLVVDRLKQFWFSRE